MKSPARYNRRTGNREVHKTFYRLPSKIQRFILWHERGHRDLDTRNEFEADDYAVIHSGIISSKMAMDHFKSLLSQKRKTNILSEIKKLKKL